MTNLRKAFASCDATWMRGSSPRMTVVGLPRNQLRKQLRIHIAAGQDADHHLATNIAKAVEFAGEQRGEPDGAALLAGKLDGFCDIRGKVVVGILSGGNVDAELFAKLIAG